MREDSGMGAIFATGREAALLLEGLSRHTVKVCFFFFFFRRLSGFLIYNKPKDFLVLYLENGFLAPQLSLPPHSSNVVARK